MSQRNATLLALISISLGGCASAPPSSTPPDTRLPSEIKVRDAMIACGGGVLNGAELNAVAKYDRTTIDGKVSIKAWRAVKVAFLEHVPADDQKDAMARFSTCVERLAGAYVEKGAFDEEKPTKEPPSASAKFDS